MDREEIKAVKPNPHPTHIWDADDRCQNCGIGDWVLIALKPCTKAPAADRPSEAEKPEFDWFTHGRFGG